MIFLAKTADGFLLHRKRSVDSKPHVLFQFTADHPSLAPRESLPPKLQIITCASTKELVFGVQNHVQAGDIVAELGAQLRQVSSAICESAERAVLVDVVRKFPKSVARETRTTAMRRQGDEVDFYPQVANFYEMNSLDEWRGTFLSSLHCNFTVLVLDVNAIVGNDLEWTSLSIIRDFCGLFPTCRTVLVKSLGLNHWASRLVHGQRWIDSQRRNQNDNNVTPTRIIATVGVQQYRNTIPYTVRSGDAVLEVGCHLGTTTVLLHQAACTEGSAIGVDVGPKIVQGAKDRHPHVSFAVGNAYKTAALLRIQQAFYNENNLQPRTGFDVLYVDVGGLSGSDGLLEALSLLDALQNALEPRCIVIKSLCMQRLASTLIPSWQQPSLQ